MLLNSIVVENWGFEGKALTQLDTSTFTDVPIPYLYLCGVIRGDHVHLLSPSLNDMHYKLMGKYCSIKCMSRVGMDNYYFIHYLEGGLEAKNTNTIEWLKKFDICNDIFNEFAIFADVKNIFYGISLGLILEKDTIDTIKHLNPKLYAQLKEQV